MSKQKHRFSAQPTPLKNGIGTMVKAAMKETYVQNKDAYQKYVHSESKGQQLKNYISMRDQLNSSSTMQLLPSKTQQEMQMMLPSRLPIWDVITQHTTAE